MNNRVWIVQNEDAEIVFVGNTEQSWRDWLTNVVGAEITREGNNLIIGEDGYKNRENQFFVEYLIPDTIFDITEFITVDCWIVPND